MTQNRWNIRWTRLKRKCEKANKFTMVELVGTMAKWFQRKNGKNNITNEVNGRKTTRQERKLMDNTKIERKQRRWTYLLKRSLLNQSSRYHVMSLSQERGSLAKLVETSMEWMKLRELGERRRWFNYGVWRSSQMRLGQHSGKETRRNH